MVLALALIVLFLWLRGRRVLTAHAGLALACAGLVALAVITPSRAAGASWIDRRFPIMALFCGLAALQLRGDVSRRFAQVLASVPPGATILPVQHDPSLALKWHAPAGRYMFGVGDATFRHFDALAVPLRHAFVPNLFAARGLQPLKVLG